MADGFTVDSSQVDQLAADLGKASVTVIPNVAKALEVTSRVIKDTVRAGLKGTWRGLVPAVSYDVHTTIGAVTAEVGYDKGTAGGALGNIREFGAPNARRTVSSGGEIIPTRGRLARPPHDDLQKALDAAQPDMEKGLSIALGDTL